MISNRLCQNSTLKLLGQLRISRATMLFTTKILKVDPSSIIFEKNDNLPTINDETTKEYLEIAAKELKDTSNVVAFPTETVYGLGGSAINDESVLSIYRVKNRPADNPLIVHVSSIEQLKRKILPQDYKIPKIYEPLLEKFSPGPLTFLLPVHEGSPISKIVTAGQSTFAVRLPANPVARALIAISDTPIAAPSANASTRPSPTLASHVYTDLQGKLPYIIDGGACDIGVESTVVDGLANPPMLLRPGGVSLEEIKKYGGPAWENIILAKKTAGKNEPVRTPGMKYRHYSPTAKVVLFTNCSDGISAVNKYISNNNLENASIALLKSKFFANASEINPLITVQRELGERGSEISRNLFKLLREVDELNVDYIFVEGIDESEEGLAVMNRLSKAASVTINGT